MKELDHYWLHAFKGHLQEANPGMRLAIDMAERRLQEAKEQLRACVDACWIETREQIKPKLRKCHQKRFDSLKVEIWHG